MALIQQAEPAAPEQTSRPAAFSAHAVITTMLCILFAIMYLDRVNISAAAAPVCTENPNPDHSGDEVVCRGKAQFLRGCESLPARVAPAGSNRSRR
ncbi:MAG TPA: hypothetical protein VK522_03570 [Pseudolabrys sp.]|nr:hypothetical protein [Pseudolabrys sp.]